MQLPKNMLKAIPKEYHDPSKGTLKLLWEEEWRALGITQVSADNTRAGILNTRWNFECARVANNTAESWMGALRSS